MRFANWVLAGLIAGTIAAPADVQVYHNGPFVPNNKLPPSHASSDGGKIVELFLKLRGSTEWKLVSKTPIEGDTGEPEGMVLVGDDRLFVSSGQWTVPTEKYNKTINGTDRSPGAGFTHLLLYDLEGRLLANSSLTKPGEIEYHGGGLDYDGRYIWITLSQYRPNSTATITRIDPLTLKSERLFRTNDHNGGIVHDTVTDNLVTLSWGSRNATTWSLKRYPRGFAPLPGFTPPKRRVTNPSFFIDYQDCKFLGHQRVPQVFPPSSSLWDRIISLGKQNDRRPLMLCGGVATVDGFNLGGLALVDTETMIPVWEVPIGLKSEKGTRLTQNPIEAQVVNGKLRVWFMPDQRESVLYIYEAH